MLNGQLVDKSCGTAIKGEQALAVSHFAAEIGHIFGLVGNWVCILDQRVDLCDNLEPLKRT